MIQNNSTRGSLAVGSTRKELNVYYRFTKESHGWLRVEETSENPNVDTIDILVHKDVVPFMKRVIDENFV